MSATSHSTSTPGWFERPLWGRLTRGTALLLVIVLLAAVLRGVDLGAIGDANPYYTAAVQSMLQSWHNFFFVAAEPGGSVTVDKPPLGLWIEAGFAAVLGVHGWAVALPNVLAGLGSVAALYYMLRRRYGSAAGLTAALAMAVTPVAVGVERNNTMDGLLAFVLILAAWAIWRAAERDEPRYLWLGALLVGLGFNIKMLQAFLPLPAFVLVYALGAQARWWRKLGHLALAGLILLVVSGAWVAAVDLTPADQRPYIGGTEENLVTELTIGHNGLQRLFGRGENVSALLSGEGNSTAGMGPGGGAAMAPGGGGRGGGGQVSGTPDANAPTDGGPGGGAPVSGTPDANAPTGGGPGGGGPTSGMPDANAPTGEAPTGGGPGGGAPGNGTPDMGGADEVGAGVGTGTAGQNTGEQPARSDGARMDGLGGMSGGAPGGSSELGQPGVWRLFQAPLSAEVSWLLPAALAGLALLAWPRPRRRTVGGIAGERPAPWNGHLGRDGQAAVLWGGWLLTCLAFFSAAEYFHAYYLVMLAPPVAALAGIVVGSLLEKDRAGMRWAAPVLWGVAALAIAYQGYNARQFGAGGLWFAVACGLWGVSGALWWATGRVRRLGDRGRHGRALSAALLVLAMAVVPLAWSWYTNQQAATTPPALGAYRGGSGASQGRGSRSVDESLLAYLQANTQDCRYLVAVSSAQEGDAYVLATGRPVLFMGGYAGNTPVVSADDLAALVAQGELKYILLGDGNGASSGIREWVQANCVAVDEQFGGHAGTLYACSAATQ